MLKKQGLLALPLGLLSCWVHASPVTPTNNVWQDSSGNLYYQQPVKQVTTADEAPVSIRVFESHPYVRIVQTANGFELEGISKSEFAAQHSEMDVVGKRLRSDFDGDGQADALIQTDLGHELLVSRNTVKPYRIGINIRDFGQQMEVRDFNYDFRADIVDKSNDKVHYAQSTGLSHAINTNDYVGSLPAQSNVSPGGEFTYNIPITLGEATGGLKPNVSLSYASNPRNGHVGVGFNIDGLSAITRCEKNMETDGVAGSVNLDQNDRFCLDGQRLIVKSGRTYGSNNSEYRTRQNTGQKIIAHTSSTVTGPYAFTVYDTQGNKLTYGKHGSAQDALIKASNNRGYTWALKRVEDASGNYYTYNYTKVNGSLEFYPTSIKYSGHGSGATRNEVRFNWEDRLDKRRLAYLKNNKITLTKRLKNIESYYSGRLLRRYNLTYGYAGTGVTESVLKKVQACSSNNKCLSPTVFNWNSRGSVRLGRDIGRDYSRNSRYKAHQFMDFNGDGLTDIAYVRNDRGSSSDHLYMIPNNGRGFGDERRFHDLANKTFRRTWKIVDYDKDGKDDILYLSGSNQHWKLMRHTSAMNFSFTSLTSISKPTNDENTRFLDIDADGYPELLHFVGNKLSYQKGTKTGLASGAAKPIKFNLNAPSGSTASMMSYDKDDNTFPAMDFNGDGRADFLAKVRVSTYNDDPFPPCDRPWACEDPRIVQPQLQAGASIKQADDNQALIPVSPKQLNPVDMSKSPAIETQQLMQQQSGLITPQGYSHSYSWKILVSQGSDTFAEFVTVSSTYNIKDIQAVELNGDGLADILYRNNSDNWYARINNGHGFNSAVYLFKYNKAALKTFDINGDGTAEVYREDHGDHFYFFNGSGFTARKLTSQGSNFDFTTFMDVTGDGTPDKLVFSGRMGLYQNSDSPATLLSSVTDGFGVKTSVSYSTLNNRSVYVPDYDARHKNWGNGRVTDIKKGARVVSLLRKGEDLFTYKYYGAKAQVGRGMLGFRQVVIESRNAGTKVVSTYRQDGDYRGAVSKVQTYVKFGSDTSSGGGGNPPPPPIDPCDEIPEMCNCNWEPGKRCEIPRTIPVDELIASPLTAMSRSELSIQSASSSSVWRLKSEVTNTHGNKRDTGFKAGSATYPYMVYPSRSVTKTYNTDTSSQTLIATKTEQLTIDSFGNPVSKKSTIDSKNGYAHTSETHTYSYSKYGGRLTKKQATKRYLNRLNGSNRGNYQNTQTVNYAYDSKGRMIKTTADNGVVTSYTLNSYGMVTKETVSSPGLPNKVLTKYYDSTNRHLTGESNSLGHRSTIGYDSLGRKYYVQTANGQRTYSTYNQLGRVTGEVSTPANNTSISGSQALSTSKVQYWCKSINHCPSNATYYEETTVEGAPDSRVYFDKYGREIRKGSVSLSGTYVYTDFTYDTKGRKYRESLPYFAGGTIRWTVYQYDKQNRVIKITKADGSVWKTEYNGEAVTNVNPLGRRNTQVKNAMGLLVKVTDANNKSADYQYDENGKSRNLKGPKGNQIQISYDKYGNKTRVVDPDKGTINYTYNKYHQLTKETDSNGNVMTYKYDVLGRITESVRKKGTTLEHHTVTSYDSGSYAKGQVFTVNDKVSGFTERYYYDAFSRSREKQTVIEGDTYKEKWEYNNSGQLTKEIDASGKSVIYTYNAHKHLASLKDSQTNSVVWRAVTVDAFGNLTKEQLGSRIVRNKGFDAETGLLTSMTTTGSGTLQNLRYDWDNLGNLNYRQDLAIGKKETFAYDTLNRVTRSTISGVATTDIRYNELGNITYKTGVGNYHYQSSRPHAVTEVTGARANKYQYDASGNMVKDNDRVLSYNTFHKPTYIEKGDYWVEFEYSGNGKRFRRLEFGGEKGALIPILNGDITKFIPVAQETRYVGKVEFIRYGGSSAWVSKRYIAGKVLVTTVNNQATTRYILDDHLGSTHVIADSNGRSVQVMSFDVFGARRDAKTWARDFSDTSKFTSMITLRGFTGHEQIDEVGLVHMGGRIYDPILGRFLQADPMVQAPENIQSLNRYSYVVNNPLNKTDPSGYIWVTLAITALKAIAASSAVSAAVATAISYALTAYTYYGYAQFAISVNNAIKGGGTAMANFLGGLSKSLAKQWLQGKVMDATGMTQAIEEIDKKFSLKVTPSAIADLPKIEAASCVYEDFAQCQGTDHYKRLSDQELQAMDLDPKDFNTESSMNAALFKDDQGKYLLVYRGTAELLPDVGADITQAFGIETTQYNEAMDLAQVVVDKLGNNVEFAGHSLGGGLAAAASMFTGNPATTINAAGVHDRTMTRKGVDMSTVDPSKIKAYYNTTDLLHIGQLLPFLPSANGKQIALTPLSSHGVVGACSSMGGKPCDYSD
ncbi:FG-GAP-like repeat-containing protein [Pseudoalteromonas luteoviolacea]|uniref:FG-GAP-like repeat-containing protein n=1 Tax=Pseudoalteromonas luteoviolacea TaxID=43657 RepID=UPI001B36D43B|nr:FG-GAP-like repeat-containing protein [Pseudoalteromonas luteoviolacea]MBQ4838461.1 VCBS repeat-containing protein [Pseudoalteromonas luteoviolacea]